MMITWHCWRSICLRCQNGFAAHFCCILLLLLQFFDILKTKNSLPDGTTQLPDVPPSLADKLAAATAAASNGHNGSSSTASTAAAAASYSGSATSSTDKQSLVEAALLLDQQQHPQHQRLLQQQHHNLGSADPEYGLYGAAPDPTLSISGLGLEVELEDVVFGYHPERQVGAAG
jgi:hypothetical protein